MSVSETEFVRINTNAKLGKTGVPFGSIQPVRDLDISVHALEKKIEQGRLVPVSEEDYLKFQSGEEITVRKRAVAVVQEVQSVFKPNETEVESEIQEEVEKIIEEEEEDLGTYTNPPPGTQEQARDDHTILEWWVKNKVTEDNDLDGTWGALCPFACMVDEDDEPTGEFKRHRQKSKLFNCCPEQSKWTMKEMKNYAK